MPEVDPTKPKPISTTKSANESINFDSLLEFSKQAEGIKTPDLVIKSSLGGVNFTLEN